MSRAWRIARRGFPRKPGAAMALWPDGGRVGCLGAGCIGADIATYLGAEQPVMHLTYGQGGPVDLPLPCGGSGCADPSAGCGFSGADRAGAA